MIFFFHRRSLLVGLLLSLPAMGAAESLQERIDATPEGGTLTLPAGEHQGPVVISRSLHLKGEPGSTIRGNGRGNTITIKGEKVTVEGLRIVRSGLKLGDDNAAVFVQSDYATVKNNQIEESLHGVYLKKANHCKVIGNKIVGMQREVAGFDQLRFAPGESENCEIALDQNWRGNGIHLWNCEDATLADNEIRDARDGIYLSFARQSRITGNTARNVRFGLHYMYSDYNVLADNRFLKSSAGAVLMYSKSLQIKGNTFAGNVGHRAYGMVMIAVDQSSIEENYFDGNSVGLFLELSSANEIRANRVTRGYIGVRLTGSSDTNRFSANVFAGNLHPVEIDSSLGENEWAVDGVGNYWATGEVDLNGDGIGELAHREIDLLGPLRRPFPLVALLSGSPALDIVRFAQQSATHPRVPTIIDPAPLVRPLEVRND